MSDQTLSDRQRKLVADSAAAAQRFRPGDEATALRPAEVGDLFVLEATAVFPVEWALLERRDETGPFLAVPADAHPFLGSRDIEVEASTGLLNLRCQASVWLDPAALDLEMRSGTLDPDGLERARLKVREVAQRGSTPDPFLEDVDLSVDYLEWLREVIHPARAAVLIAQAVQPFQPVPVARERPSSSWWMAAAAVFFLVATGLAVWALRQHRQIEDLAARALSSEAALRQEQARREEEQTTIEALKEREDQEVNELRERIAALERRPEAGAQPLLNPPVAILLPAEVTRGTEAKSYQVPADAPFLTVVLKFREDDSYPAYRLILTRQGSRQPVLKTDGLERSPEGVQVALPRRYVPPGSYRLSLAGLQSGKAQPVADYELAVTR